MPSTAPIVWNSPVSQYDTSRSSVRRSSASETTKTAPAARTVAQVVTRDAPATSAVAGSAGAAAGPGSSGAGAGTPVGDASFTIP